jgi:sulfite reductase alpha subunit-like flavoprotein
MEGGNGGGAVFVCGDGMAMAKDVHRALTQCVLGGDGGDIDGNGGGGGMTVAGAETLLEGLKEEGRYVQDIWS